MALGQLVVLLPGSIWFGGWFNHAIHDIVEQRLGTATRRHTLQLADLINDLDLSDLVEGSDDRNRLQQLIDRMGRPYGAALVVIRPEDGRVLAQPREMGLSSLRKEALAGGNGSDGKRGDMPIAVRPLDAIGLTLVALPHRGDVANLVKQFTTYVRWIVIALLVVIVSVSTMLTTFIVYRYENRLAGINTNLEALVAKRSGELLKSRNAVIFGLAMLAESRDGQTGLHLERIRDYVRLLGEQLRNTHPEVDDEYIDIIEETSALHDIGKVGVPDSVLLNPEELSDAERDIMKKHPYIGFDTMMEVRRRWGDDQFLVTACQVCIAHHERWDGKGYPFGLKGENIPLAARIVALADVYDALTTERVYKDALPHDHAREYIVNESGSHFDPAIVEAFLNCEHKFRAVVDSGGARGGS